MYLEKLGRLDEIERDHGSCSTVGWLGPAVQPGEGPIGAERSAVLVDPEQPVGITQPRALELRWPDDRIRIDPTATNCRPPVVEDVGA